MSGWVLAVLLFSLSWLPWKVSAADDLAKAKVHVYEGYTVHARPYAASYGDGTISWCPVVGDDAIGDLLHESQHYLVERYELEDVDWEKFNRLAMRTLREGDYSRKQILTAKYVASYGGSELHASLPWIVEGRLAPVLQRWYPWFQLVPRRIE